MALLASVMLLVMAQDARIEWEQDYEAALRKAKAANRPIMVRFRIPG